MFVIVDYNLFLIADYNWIVIAGLALLKADFPDNKQVQTSANFAGRLRKIRRSHPPNFISIGQELSLMHF